VSGINPERLTSEKYIDCLLEQLLELRPKEIKKKYFENNTINVHELEIYDLIKLSHVHPMSNKLNEGEIKIFKIDRYYKSEKTFKTVVELDKKENYDNEMGNYFVEEYLHGKIRSRTNVHRIFINNENSYPIVYTSFIGYEIIEVFHKHSRKRHSLMIFHNGKCSLFLKFKNEHICYQCLPISQNDDETLSINFFTTGVTIVLMLGLVYAYFKSLIMTLLIFGISISILATTESFNPRQKGIIRVIQIIIYALVIVFIQ